MSSSDLYGIWGEDVSNAQLGFDISPWELLKVPRWLNDHMIFLSNNRQMKVHECNGEERVGNLASNISPAKGTSTSLVLVVVGVVWGLLLNMTHHITKLNYWIWDVQQNADGQIRTKLLTPFPKISSLWTEMNITILKWVMMDGVGVSWDFPRTVNTTNTRWGDDIKVCVMRVTSWHSLEEEEERERERVTGMSDCQSWDV